jgi:uncharacterized protein YbjT (DUF2867 family)
MAVKVLVRDAQGAGAQSLAKLGARLVQGDLDDDASLKAATSAADAVFSVQLFTPTDPSSEVRQARSLIAAARANGVKCFIQSSVSGVGAYASWSDDARWDRPYWQSKATIEDAALSAGFASTTILRPAFMMENFIAPKAQWMFPGLDQDLLRTAVSAETKLALVAADDIGAAAALAIGEPSGFATLELAGDVLSMEEIGATLSEACRTLIRVRTATAAEAIASGQNPGWVRAQQWLNEVGYPARPEHMISMGLKPTRFAVWAREQRA